MKRLLFLQLFLLLLINQSHAMEDSSSFLKQRLHSKFTQEKEFFELLDAVKQSAETRTYTVHTDEEYGDLLCYEVKVYDQSNGELEIRSEAFSNKFMIFAKDKRQVMKAINDAPLTYIKSDFIIIQPWNNGYRVLEHDYEKQISENFVWLSWLSRRHQHIPLAYKEDNNETAYKTHLLLKSLERQENNAIHYETTNESPRESSFLKKICCCTIL